MIETKEQYQEIIDTMPAQAIGKAMYLTAIIEALREVARAANQQRFISVSHPQLWNEELGDALDALPDWITES